MPLAGTYSGKSVRSDPDTQSILSGGMLSVESGGVINIETGGIIKANGTQATAIADETAITGGQDPTEAEFNALLVKFNAVLAALRGAGIIASA